MNIYIETMELFDITEPIQERIANVAVKKRIPIGGTMELLPMCNMDCKMCYVRLSKTEMEKQGRLLTAKEWVRIAQEARDAGVLSLLLTGGEPLLYPEFDALYTELTGMGFILTMNTNGTLINEQKADLMASRPIRRVNITLYGPDDETYGKLCNNPKGFTQVMRAVKLLEERKIPFMFKCSVTPDNVKHLHQIFEIAREHHVFLQPSMYMFPPIRKGGVNTERFIRLSAKESAAIKMQCMFEHNPTKSKEEIAIHLLSKIGKMDVSGLEGPLCNAGRCAFWMNWKGELQHCGFFSKPKISLLDHSFQEAWNYVTTEVKQIKRCKECDECIFYKNCPSCAAACLAETGSSEGKPTFLCERTHELIRLCEEILEKSNQPIKKLNQ